MLNYSEDMYKPSERRRAAQQNKRGKVLFLSILGGMVLINLIVLIIILSQAKTQSNQVLSTESLWENNDYESLSNSAERALIEDPNNYEYQIIYGYSLYRLMMDGAPREIYLPKAIATLQEAANSPESRGDKELYGLLGKLYYMTGNSYEAAILWLDKALEIKREAETLLLSGLANYAIGNLPDAMEDIDQFRALTGNPMGALLKGKLALDQRDFSEAERSFLLVSNTATQPEIEYLSMLLLAENQVEQGRFGEAQRLLDTELVGDGELAHEYYLRGVILEAQGRNLEARAMWRKALSMDPTHKQSIGKIL